MLPSGSHNIVNIDLMSNVVDVFDLLSVECDLGIPQPILVGNIRDVEEQTKSVVIFEAIVYVALCKQMENENY